MSKYLIVCIYIKLNMNLYWCLHHHMDHSSFPRLHIYNLQLQKAPAIHLLI